MDEDQDNTPNSRRSAEIQRKDKLRARIYRESLRWFIVKTVSKKAPNLASIAEKSVATIQRVDALDELAMQVAEETNVTALYQLLEKAAYRGKWNIYSELDEIFHQEMLKKAQQLDKRDELREAAVAVVKVRFPTLVLLAKKYVECLLLHEVLEQVIVQLLQASDEAEVRAILDIEADKQRQRERVVALVKARFPELGQYVEQEVEKMTSLHHLYCLPGFLEHAVDQEGAKKDIDLIVGFRKR